MDISEQIIKSQPDNFDVVLRTNVEKIVEDSTNQNLSDELLLTNNKNASNKQPIIENINTDNTNVMSIENNIDNKIATSADINLINNESVDMKVENESHPSNSNTVYEQSMGTEENSSNQENNSNSLLLQENSKIQNGNNEALVQNMNASFENQQISELTLSEEMPIPEINNEEKTQKEIEVKSMDCEINSKKYTDHQISEELEKKNTTVSSLATIAAAYNSSDSDVTKSDIEDDVELCKDLQHTRNEIAETCKEKSKNIYRVNEEVIISSDENDSDTDSSSSSSSSSDLSSAKSNANESDDDIQNSSVSRNTQKSRYSTKETKSELDGLPPIEELRISVPEVLCDPFGEVAWTVEQLVVVRPKPGKPTLNLDTILFVERGQRALGKIFDVFGQVSEPYYCVRFNSSEHIQENKIKVGMLVYYCPNTEYTSLVFLHELTKMKGADEGGAEDEPPDFSDDEEERRYYEALKKKGPRSGNNGNEGVPHKRSRTTNPTGYKSNHPWNRTARFYSRRQDGCSTNMNSWQGNPMQNSYNSHHQWQAGPTEFPHQNNLWCQPMHPNIPPNPNNQYENAYFHPPVLPMQSSAYDADAYRQLNNPYQATQSHNQQHSYTNAPVDPRSQVPSVSGPMWYPLPPPPPPPPL